MSTKRKEIISYKEKLWKCLKGEEEGFTLVELIVVVVIIGILSSIAVPSFQNMKYRADEAEAKLIANSVIKSAFMFKTRDSVMPSTWAQIATEIPSFKYCKYRSAVQRTCGKDPNALLPVLPLNSMNCIVVTNASYELCGRKSKLGFSIILREFVSIAEPSPRKSISACLGNEGQIKVIKNPSRKERWISC